MGVGRGHRDEGSAGRSGGSGGVGGSGRVGGSDLGAPTVLDVLSQWAAELRADAAAASRSRERWLRQQSAEEARFAGALIDLAEQGRPIVAHNVVGERIRGRVACVGTDFVGLETERATTMLVRLDHLTAVRANALGTDLASDRAPTLELDLAEALRALSEDRPRVRLTLGTADALTGVLRSVGVDVASLRLEGDERATLYVRLAAINEVLLV